MKFVRNLVKQFPHSVLRSITPIYSSLEQLLEHNKGVFKLFQKSKTPGLLRAIWDGREGHIECLQIQLSMAQKKLCELREIHKREYDQHQGERQKAQEREYLLQNTIANLQAEVEQLSSQLEGQKEEGRDLRRALERHQALNHSLDNALGSKAIESSEDREVVEYLEKMLAIRNRELDQLREEFGELQTEISLRESECGKARQEVERAVGEWKQVEMKNRHYKRLNHNMEAELFRLKQALDRQNTQTRKSLASH